MQMFTGDVGSTATPEQVSDKSLEWAVIVGP